MNDEIAKVRIMNAEYKEDRDLFVWTLNFIETGDEQAFCWPSVDLLGALGISTDKQIPAEYLHKFCNDMLGKEINFVVQGLPEYSAPDLDNGDPAEISTQMTEHFETFRMHVDGES